MNITKAEKYTLFTITGSFEDFSKELNKVLAEVENENLVMDFSNINVTENQIKSLENIANHYTENNLSFVIVATNFDVDALEEEWNIVPTLVEAEDIIDMEAIARDLGF